MLILVATGGYFTYNKYNNQRIQITNPPAVNTANIKSSSPQTDSLKPANEGKFDLAATASVKVSINSDPSGARIFVNGIDTLRTTPAIIALPANIESAIKLKSNDSYYDYDLKKIFKEAESLTLSLQKLPKSGFINLSVQNGGANPVLYINGRRLTEAPPLKKYKVTPNTELVIQAVNPITQLRDEVTVIVPQDEEKNIELILGRKN